MHAMFSSKRYTSGQGREWFKAPLDAICSTVARVLRSPAIVNGESPTTQEDGTEA